MKCLTSILALARMFGVTSLALGAAGTVRAQGVQIYCDCTSGLGPCGNGADSGVPGGCIDSQGLKAFLLDSGGSSSVASDDLLLAADKLPPNQNGILFMGPGQGQLPFGDGLLCVSPASVGIFRFAVQNTGVGGDTSFGPGIVATSHARFRPAGRIQAGQTWNFQFWYRDPNGPCGTGFNTTNALSVRFVP
jgi:hypothetical protein